MDSPVTQSRKTRVYVVDSYALIRRGLRELIVGEADMEVCGEGETAATAFAGIMKLKPDLVTVEITLRGNSGLELIKSIRSFDPTIGILVVSMCEESVYGMRVLKAGARGFTSKAEVNGRIVDAIRRIRAGQLYISGEIERQMLSSIVGGEVGLGSESMTGLSDRELEIGNLIGGGVTTREIATRLHLSVKTIETHRANLKRKLSLTTGTRLLQFWVRWVERQVGHPDAERSRAYPEEGGATRMLAGDLGPKTGAQHGTGGPAG